MKVERDWAMAQYYDGKKYYSEAKRYYKSLIDQYPNTPYAAQAKPLAANPKRTRLAAEPFQNAGAVVRS